MMHAPNSLGGYSARLLDDCVRIIGKRVSG